MAIDILGRHMSLGAGLKQLQDFQPRCGGFEANAFKVVGVCHFVFRTEVET
jgi:hypothetical protein